MFNRPVASEACFRRADSRSHNGHSACASPSASATSCSRVVSAEIECAGARASTARASSPRETAEPRADPAVAAGELVDQRDAPSPARCGCIAAPTPTAPRRRGRQAHRPPRGRSPDPVRPRTRPARRFERLMDQIRGRLGEGSVQLGRGMPAAHDAPHPMTFSPQGRVTDEQLQSAVRSS